MNGPHELVHKDFLSGLNGKIQRLETDNLKLEENKQEWRIKAHKYAEKVARLENENARLKSALEAAEDIAKAYHSIGLQTIELLKSCTGQ